jgi:hypothetical protein
MESIIYEVFRCVVLRPRLVPASFLGPDILFGSSFAKTLNLRSSLMARDQISCIGKLIVSYILICKFSDTPTGDMDSVLCR